MPFYAKSNTTFLFILLVCSTLPVLAQQNIATSLMHDQLERQYIVHLPPGHTGAEAKAAVIVLHGGSGNYQSVQGFTQMNLASNQNDFLAIYPQGIGIAPPGFSWADGRGTSADAANIDDVGFIDALIDTLAEEYNIDLNRVYISGFSNGGFMTQRLACELNERFAAIGGLGCSMDTTLFQSCASSSPIPMMYVSGTNDPEVPYLGGPMNNPNVTPIVAVDTAVQFWVNHNNCQQVEPVTGLPDLVESDSSTVQLLRFTDCDCESEVVFYRVLNGGHTWPGVPIAQFPQLGNTNEDIHASFVLWDFFNQHENCSEISAVEEVFTDIPIQLYPNPTDGALTVTTTANIQHIRILDGAGQLVWEGAEQQLDISLYPQGLYFVQITTVNSFTTVKKVVKN